MMIEWRTVFAGTALLGTAFALTACEGIAQSRVESDARARNARYAAQGNPQFSDPQLQAVVKKFEGDYAVFGLDAGKLGLEQGTPCPATAEAAFRTVFGMTQEAYDELQQEITLKVPAHTEVADPNSVRLVTLSGDCGAEGPEGPAVVVGSKRTIMRVRGDGYGYVTVTDTVVRIDATWAGGEQKEQRSAIAIYQSAQFKETEEGQLAEDINDWEYLNELRSAPGASYTYTVPNPDGTVKYQAIFSRNDGAGIYGTMVMENLDDHHAYARNWQGTELMSEGSYKDGKTHGWFITHPTVYNGTEIPGRRDCYQNGELIKALECPST